ncbi:uncharacterized protein LOC121909806 isoform X1 [Thunnus maccoyii]|uniref:uncharacterized protein LOC121909806 isoform X1 n=2 Tax=Thunnus maccoyii TaxID=8240 RepID=UPI001C4C33FF|nr:uncharacterized protein LOC121909806 isoform X1 [Thunnus maccoyii]
MSINISESKWKTALTSILEELDESEYKKMLLCSCLDKIPKGVKTGRSREEMPQIIIQYLGVDESISAINKAMEQLPRNDSAVQDLLRPFVDKPRNKCEENRDQPQSSQPDKEKKTSSVTESCRIVGKDHISTDQELRMGDFLISKNGKYQAVFQEDGNFVILADGDERPIWATGTNGWNPFRLIVQQDNNVVMYTKENKPVWASGTWTHRPWYSTRMRLTMTNDGLLVLDKDGKTIWSDGKKWE